MSHTEDWSDDVMVAASRSEVVESPDGLRVLVRLPVADVRALVVAYWEAQQQLPRRDPDDDTG